MSLPQTTPSDRSGGLVEASARSPLWAYGRDAGRLPTAGPDAPIADCDEAEQRRRVVVEARSWILTPFHHAADVKGAGVDCSMLVVRVYVDLGLVAPFDPRPYPPDWYLHRSRELYLEQVLPRAKRVDKPGLGDVFLIRYGRAFAHGGIVTQLDPLTVVHAFHQHGYVIEEEIGRCYALSERLKHAIYASYWG